MVVSRVARRLRLFLDHISLLSLFSPASPPPPLLFQQWVCDQVRARGAGRGSGPRGPGRVLRATAKMGGGGAADRTVRQGRRREGEGGRREKGGGLEGKRGRMKGVWGGGGAGNWATAANTNAGGSSEYSGLKCLYLCPLFGCACLCVHRYFNPLVKKGLSLPQRLLYTWAVRRQHTQASLQRSHTYSLLFETEKSARSLRGFRTI